MRVFGRTVYKLFSKLNVFLQKLASGINGCFGDRRRVYTVIIIVLAYSALCGRCFYKIYGGVPLVILVSNTVGVSFGDMVAFASRFLIINAALFLAGCTVFSGAICFCGSLFLGFCYGFACSNTMYSLCSKTGLGSYYLLLLLTGAIALSHILICGEAVRFSSYVSLGTKAMLERGRLTFYFIRILLITAFEFGLLCLIFKLFY